MRKLPRNHLDPRPIYYVYVLFDWLGVPRYIGKGKGRRWLKHETATDPINWMKNEFIDQTWTVLGEIPKIKVCEDVDERSAFEIERALIQVIGRFPNGPLTNMSDGGDGGWYKSISSDQRRIIMAKVNASFTKEQLKKRGQRAQQSRTPEQRKASAAKAKETVTHKQRSEWIKKGHIKRDKNELLETAKRGHAAMMAGRSSESFSLASQKTWETRRKNPNYSKPKGPTLTFEQRSELAKKGHITKRKQGYTKKGIMKICENCKKSFYVKQSGANTKFCSNKCYRNLPQTLFKLKGWETRRLKKIRKTLLQLVYLRICNLEARPASKTSSPPDPTILHQP